VVTGAGAGAVWVDDALGVDTLFDPVPVGLAVFDEDEGGVVSALTGAGTVVRGLAVALA